MAFLAGQYMADQCHEDRAKAIAKEQSAEDEASRLTQPEWQSQPHCDGYLRQTGEVSLTC